MATDGVGRATTVWISSLNSNSLFVLLLEHLSSYLLHVKTSEGWYSGDNIEFKLRVLIHDQAHPCPPNWNSFLYVYSYPTGGNLIDFTLP